MLLMVFSGGVGFYLAAPYINTSSDMPEDGGPNSDETKTLFNQQYEEETKQPYVPPVKHLRTAATAPQVHYVMTSDCSRYSDWQAVVSYYSLRKSGFTGKFTRLIACDKKEGRSMSRATGYTDYFINSFEDNHPGPKFFPPLAKPTSLNAWSKDINGGGSIPDDQQIVLIDQDFILLDPLTPQAPSGKPMAQKYGMGDQALRAGVVGRDHCEGCKDIVDFTPYIVGPPYMLSMGDLRKIAPIWRSKTIELITDKSTWSSDGRYDWLSDMYGYMIATINLKLPHVVRTDWMISDAGSDEEWRSFLLPNARKTTPILHTCHGYEADGLSWVKHDFHERKAIALLSCNPETSNRKFLNTLLGDRHEMSKDLFTSTELPFRKDTFQEALEATKKRQVNAKHSRQKWALGNVFTLYMEAFNDYRLKMCGGSIEEDDTPEPMDMF